jgi:sortase A
LIRNIISTGLILTGLLLAGAGLREYLLSVQPEIPAEWASNLTADTPAASVLYVPPGDALARLSIPRLDKQMLVVSGTSKRQLRKGPGHLTGTAAPGSLGNCVIAGHRDTHFRMLKDVVLGDEIVLENGAGRFHYTVVKTSIVSPKDTRSLKPTEAAVLNLITCYPFYYLGPAPKRFVVQAELAQPSPSRVAPVGAALP